MNSSNRLVTFLRSPRFPIFMIVFVDVLGLGITIPVLPLFAQNQLGAAAWQITTLTSVFFAAQFIASPFLGRLSDRFGRRPVLIVSQAGTLTALLINGFAPSIGFLYLSRVIDGLTGGNITVAQAYLTDVTDEKNRARGLGLINAAFSLGFIFGPAFGGLVASQFGPRVPFFIAAVFSFTTIMLSTFLLPESLTPERRRHEQHLAARHPRASVGAVLRTPSIALILLVAFGSQFGFFLFQTVWVLWAQRLLFPNEAEAQVSQAVGLIATFIGVVGIATQVWLVGPAVKRFGELRLVLAGNSARIIAFGTLALFPVLYSVFVAVPLISMGGGLAMPAIIALLTYAAPPNARGQVIGLNQSASALGSIIGPILAGVLFEQVNPDAPMYAAAFTMLLTVLAGLPLLRMHLVRHSQPMPSPPIEGASREATSMEV